MQTRTGYANPFLVSNKSLLFFLQLCDIFVIYTVFVVKYFLTNVLLVKYLWSVAVKRIFGACMLIFHIVCNISYVRFYFLFSGMLRERARTKTCAVIGLPERAT